MRPRQIGFAFLLLLLIGGLLMSPGSAESDYEIDIVDDGDVTIIQAPSSVSAADDEAIAVAEPGAEITADVSGPAEEPYDVFLRDSQANIPDWFALDVEGSDTVSVATDGYDPGTYAGTVEENNIEAISPIILEAYEITTEGPPEDASEGDAIEITAKLDAHDEAVAIDSVVLVAWDGDDGERLEMSEEEDNTYTASVSELDAAEYQFQIIVYGEDEIADEIFDELDEDVDDVEDEIQNELIAISDRWTDTVPKQDNDDDENDSGDDTNGAGGSGPGGAPGGAPGGTDPGSDDGNETTDNGADAPDNQTDVESPTTQTVNITDTEPDADGTTTSFDDSAVNSITFSATEASGTVTISDYGESLPPNAPEIDDRPAISGVEITVPDDLTDSEATIELTLTSSEVQDADVEPGAMTVLKATGNGYESLETTVIDADDGVVLEAETPGFSAFVVSTDENATQSEDPPNQPANGNETNTESNDTDTDTEDDSVIEPNDGQQGNADSTENTTNEEQPVVESQSGFGVPVALFALALLSLVTIARRIRPDAI